MADGPIPIEAALPSRIRAYQSISLEDFRSRFSSETSPPSHFSDPIGHFTTNEYDYPSSLDKIRVRGGLHLAVMGGLDPVFGQIAVAHPDLTIIADINSVSITSSIEGRLKPLAESQTGKEYWNKVRDYFTKVVRKKGTKRYDIPNDQDISLGGWSNKDHYSAVQEALRQGKIKFIAGDLTKEGLELAMKIAKDTHVPIRLIYISNIFDYLANNQEEFRKKLRRGIGEGLIDEKAQVVDTGTSEKGIVTKVIDIEDYITARA